MNKKSQNNDPQEIEFYQGILSNLVKEHFKGENEEMLNGMLEVLPFNDLRQFVEATCPPSLIEKDIENLNEVDIEQLDLFAIAEKIAQTVDFEQLPKFDEQQMQKFDDAMKAFFHNTLHDFAFPMLAFENSNVAISAQNMIKRMLTSLTEQGIAIEDVYGDLDIENLPVKPSMELFLKHGGKFPGMKVPEDVNEAEEVVEDPDYTVAPGLLHCDLSPDQALYLAYVLKEDYDLIKKCMPFANLLKSLGKKYESIQVNPDRKKLGLLLSVISVLYEMRTSMGERYLRTDKGNGIWPFFQGFLLEAPDKLFTRDLRKCFNENKDEETAKGIIEDIIAPKNQIRITTTVNELLKTLK